MWNEPKTPTSDVPFLPFLHPSDAAWNRAADLNDVARYNMSQGDYSVWNDLLAAGYDEASKECSRLRSILQAEFHAELDANHGEGTLMVDVYWHAFQFLGSVMDHIQDSLRDLEAL
jgi:hypothetical protein